MDVKSYRIKDLNRMDIPLGLPIIEAYVQKMFIGDVYLVYNTDTTVYFEIEGQLYTPEKVMEHIQYVERNLPIAKECVKELIEANGNFPAKHPKLRSESS